MNCVSSGKTILCDRLVKNRSNHRCVRVKVYDIEKFTSLPSKAHLTPNTRNTMFAIFVKVFYKTVNI